MKWFENLEDGLKFIVIMGVVLSVLGICEAVVNVVKQLYPNGVNP